MIIWGRKWIERIYVHVQSSITIHHYLIADNVTIHFNSNKTQLIIFFFLLHRNFSLGKDELLTFVFELTNESQPKCRAAKNIADTSNLFFSDILTFLAQTKQTFKIQRKQHLQQTECPSVYLWCWDASLFCGCGLLLGVGPGVGERELDQRQLWLMDVCRPACGKWTKRETSLRWREGHGAGPGHVVRDTGQEIPTKRVITAY